MNRIAAVSTLIISTALCGAPLASQAASPNAVLKAQLRTQKAKVAKLQAQLAKTKRQDAATITGLKTQAGTIPGLNATIAGLTADKATLGSQVTTLTTQVTTLNAQITQQAQGGLAAVLAGNPNDWWNAVTAIWQVFPNQTTTLCGYQKQNYLFVSSSFTHTEYDFSSYTNCAP